MISSKNVETENWVIVMQSNEKGQIGPWNAVYG